MNAMVVSDLDGTLIRRDRGFAPDDVETLRDLGGRGVLRCIATGRSLYSADQVLPRDLPIDYLVFSSGAGTLHWPTRRLAAFGNMSAGLAKRTFRMLHRRGLDFMVHRPVPENHRFLYVVHAQPHPDFARRLERYREVAEPCDPELFEPGEVCQFVVIGPGSAGEPTIRAIRAAVPEATVIRTTSPLDGETTWVEIFASGVCKSAAASRLAAEHGLGAEQTLAIGNDFNDWDLLEWAGTARVVRSSPPELTRRFAVLDGGAGGSLTRAVRSWGRAIR